MCTKMCNCFLKNSNDPLFDKIRYKYITIKILKIKEFVTICHKRIPQPELKCVLKYINKRITD